jgi:hypothetical protein
MTLTCLFNLLLMTSLIAKQLSMLFVLSKLPKSIAFRRNSAMNVKSTQIPTTYLATLTESHGSISPCIITRFAISSNRPQITKHSNAIPSHQSLDGLLISIAIHTFCDIVLDIEVNKNHHPIMMIIAQIPLINRKLRKRCNLSQFNQMLAHPTNIYHKSLDHPYFLHQLKSATENIIILACGMSEGQHFSAYIHA